jgi:hypothetical protein
MTSLKEKEKERKRRNRSSSSMTMGRLSLSLASWTNLSPWKRHKERGEVSWGYLWRKKGEGNRGICLRLQNLKIERGGTTEQGSWDFIWGICCGEHGSKHHCSFLLLLIFFWCDFTDMLLGKVQNIVRISGNFQKSPRIVKKIIVD